MLSSSTILDVISPRHFQRRMSALLEKLDSTICVMDDILVFGATPEEHNKRLAAVLERLADTGVTLNNEVSIQQKGNSLLWLPDRKR